MTKKTPYQFSPEHLSDDEKQELILEHNKRSLCEVKGKKQLEEGEQNTAYFFQVKKSHGQFNSI